MVCDRILDLNPMYIIVNPEQFKTDGVVLKVYILKRALE